ncbi:hypothetical protein HQO84_01920 [Rhodococcus fascians]|nr:hypothetical protein [Rhodococcus fascians]MBY3995150.1 hypothetical protein [Rhodococcus fascians]MBY4000530.1 hypothetical protein [Rhodococcus fascians]MBY4005558.1 hypothetical protein [Rhodococcus fascians]MBY4016391.1 hypothetical protein [Rhodococcus fascians]
MNGPSARASGEVLRRWTIVSVSAMLLLLCFAALGAAVATAMFGLVFGMMTLGLLGLGWVMMR